MNHYTYPDSPLGRMLLTSDGHALTGLYFVGQKYQAVPPDSDWTKPRAEPFAQVRAELAEYFAGARSASTLRSRPRARRFRSACGARSLPFRSAPRVSYLALARIARCAAQCAGGCRGGRAQSDLGPHSLSPSHRQRWLAHRVRRRAGAQAQIAGAGSRGGTTAATPEPENRDRHGTRRVPDVSFAFALLRPVESSSAA